MDLVSRDAVNLTWYLTVFQSYIEPIDISVSFKVILRKMRHNAARRVGDVVRRWDCRSAGNGEGTEARIQGLRLLLNVKGGH